MKITKKQWEEIQDYIFEHSKEIWDLGVSHTSNIHDAIVWLDGIREKRYKLWAGMYTTGTVEHPYNVPGNLLLYWLPKHWYDDISDEDMCIEWEDGRPKKTENHCDYDYKNAEANFLSDEEYHKQLYEVGYELFLEELEDNEFWEKMMYANNIEVEKPESEE